MPRRRRGRRNAAQNNDAYYHYQQYEYDEEEEEEYRRAYGDDDDYDDSNNYYNNYDHHSRGGGAAASELSSAESGGVPDPYTAREALRAVRKFISLCTAAGDRALTGMAETLGFGFAPLEPHMTLEEQLRAAAAAVAARTSGNNTNTPAAVATEGRHGASSSSPSFASRLPPPPSPPPPLLLSVIASFYSEMIALQRQLQMHFADGPAMVTATLVIASHAFAAADNTFMQMNTTTTTTNTTDTANSNRHNHHQRRPAARTNASVSAQGPSLSANSSSSSHSWVGAQMLSAAASRLSLLRAALRLIERQLQPLARGRRRFPYSDKCPLCLRRYGQEVPRDNPNPAVATTLRRAGGGDDECSHLERAALPACECGRRHCGRVTAFRIPGCHHSVCLPCLWGLADHADGFFTCPLCDDGFGRLTKRETD